ncbi:MAG: polyribonucleotide nucleotidyltransferase [Candidatus Paceibacterota bacterium]|nr:MAG: polyribonucleotide nucleotidyltransferase [Candidatus Paceibacterota bacterium]
MQEKTYTRTIAGRTLSVQLGKLAQQANGSCLVQYGETTVLVTAVMGADAKDVDYLPLSVDYEERYYAAGKMKESKWMKREGRPPEEAILTGRLIDRAIRPRFNHDMRNEIQVVATVLSFDRENDPDMVAMFGASLALLISDIPWDGPIAGVRVSRDGSRMIAHPTYSERTAGDFDIAIAGTKNRINMIEGGARIVPEAQISEAVAFGFQAMQELIAFQEEIAAEVSVKKRQGALASIPDDVSALVAGVATPLLDRAEGGLYAKTKEAFYTNVADARAEVKNAIDTAYAGRADIAKVHEQAMVAFERVADAVVHKNVLDRDMRPDGRSLTEVRDLSVQVGVLPRVHGSALFQRGQTQALSVLTLAAPGMEQWIETMEIELTKKHFMHHYVFPPFSVGETGRMGSPGRREIGHGALAERSLEPIIPSRDTFPYTIRVVSEILGSNGSSSMASVCGSSLALMEGGVPIVAPAAGIAMGIMFDGAGEKYKILTDIQGPEDHYGDMDLKIAGTRTGVTGMQMDVKVEGITPAIFTETLAQAREARIHILDAMERVIAAPRAELSPLAPRVHTLHIDPKKIGMVIGSQGKTINEITETTGASIDIEDDGTIFVASPDASKAKQAIDWIEAITYEPKPGDAFQGTVTRILDFGAFVEFMPGKEGMVHISEINGEQLDHPSKVLREGQSVSVTVKEVDAMGRINLTMLPPGVAPAERPARHSSGPRRDGGRSRPPHQKKRY